MSSNPQIPKQVTSHDYALSLQHAAAFFLSRPAFDIDYTRAYSFSYFRFYKKEQFIAAVKALGSGTKGGDDKEIEFLVRNGDVEITVSAPRNTLCRLIRPAEYDCDPFLSPNEEKQLGSAAPRNLCAEHKTSQIADYDEDHDANVVAVGDCVMCEAAFERATGANL